jgi:hypothetical protein
MLSCVVNSRLQPRRAAHLLDLRHRDEKPLIASPLDSALTNCDAHNPFRFRFYENCRVSPLFPIKNLKSYLRFLFPSHALCSLFSLFAPRVFQNSFAHKWFHTLSKNSRGLSHLFPSWNSLAVLPSLPPRSSSHQSPTTSHLLRLTPSPSADSINLHPADRFFTRQSHPHGGGTP